MEAKTTTVKTITFSLTEQEARWLKVFIQNYPGPSVNESSEEAQYRSDLFELLLDFGV
jgi:hypothetical protein